MCLKVQYIGNYIHFSDMNASRAYGASIKWKRKTLRYLITWTLVLLSFVSCGKEQADESGMAKVGTHRLHYVRMGSGSPTVVLDAGLGETYRDWLPLLEEIAQSMSVVAYDRAGYGESEPGPFPRDCEREAEELHLLLFSLKAKGPLILLGHSLGAMNMQVFANQHPEKVGGIILIDPPPIGWLNGMGFPRLYQMAEAETAAMKQKAGTVHATSESGDNRELHFLEAKASEHEQMLHGSAVEVAEIASFGDLPLYVIASEKPNERFGEDGPAYQQFWNTQCKDLAYKSIRGEYLLASGSGHQVHLDAPDLIASAVKQMASTIKK